MWTVLLKQMTNAKFCVGDLLKTDSWKIGEHVVKICLKENNVYGGDSELLVLSEGHVGPRALV